MPLISVIMPAYNASKYISEAIESILKQTEPDFELLICDDGSKDNTLSIINMYAEYDKRIKVFENGRNIGNLKTSNFLFSQCQGKYITIQDADDYSLPVRFELLLKAFEKDKELGMVGSNYEIVDENKTAVSCGLLPLKNEDIKSVMTKEVVPMLYASVMVKKEIVERVGFFRLFFDRKGYADMDWLNRCAEVSKVTNIREILYFYRHHSHSFTYIEKSNTNLILKNIHLLLVQAHLLRIKGEEDFFETNDVEAMRNVICNNCIKRAENYYWEGHTKRAFNKLWIAIKANVFEIKIYRTFFFIFRKNIFNKVVGRH